MVKRLELPYKKGNLKKINNNKKKIIKKINKKRKKIDGNLIVRNKKYIYSTPIEASC